MSIEVLTPAEAAPFRTQQIDVGAASTKAEERNSSPGFRILSPQCVRLAQQHELCFWRIPYRFDFNIDSKQTSLFPSGLSVRCHPRASALSYSECPDVARRTSTSPTRSTSQPHSGHQARMDRRRRMTRTFSVSTVISVLLWAMISRLQSFVQLRNRERLLAILDRPLPLSVERETTSPC
jgi:hypothetical protein